MWQLILKLPRGRVDVKGCTCPIKWQIARIITVIAAIRTCVITVKLTRKCYQNERQLK